VVLQSHFAIEGLQQGEQISVLGTGFGPYRKPVPDGFMPLNPPTAFQTSIGRSTGHEAAGAFQQVREDSVPTGRARRQRA
jgi:hypothetical protein